MSNHFSWQSSVVNSDLSASEKLTLLVIGTYMNMHGSGAFPSYAEISRASSLSRRKVMDAVSVAEQRGFISKTKRERANGSSSSNEYEISYPSESGAPGGELSSLGSESGALCGEYSAPRITPQLNTPLNTPFVCVEVAADESDKDLNATTWKAYSDAFFDRYKTEPVRNAKVNGQIAQLTKRIGKEAPDVAAYYLTHNKRWYVEHSHSVDSLLKDAEGLRTQWATNKQVTESNARSADRLGSSFKMFEDLDMETPF